MNILSYNIRQGGFDSYNSKSVWPEKMVKLIKTVKEINADVVSLVDTFRWTELFTKEKLKDLFGFENIYQIDIDDKSIGISTGLTVMTNLKVKKFEIVKIYNRNIVKTSLENIDIFTVYLSHKNENTRVKQVTSLLKQTNSKRPTVLIGDFNTIDKKDVVIPGLEILNPLITEMKKRVVTEIIKKRGFIDADVKKRNTAPTIIMPVLRVDYAFVKNVKVLNFKVLRDKVFDNLSDHYPIMLEIE